MANFEFISDTHTYLLDGKPLMSVSELVNPLAQDMGAVDELTLEAAAERGTTCHKLLELLLNGEDIEGEYPDEYQCYVDGIELFLSEHDITPLYIEQPIYSEELGLAGTPDLICLFDGEMAIVDYKFVSQVQKTKLGAQVTAYKAMCEDNGIDIDAMYIAHFLPTGKYRLYPVEDNRERLDLLLKLRAERQKKHARGRIE